MASKLEMGSLRLLMSSTTEKDKIENFKWNLKKIDWIIQKLQTQRHLVKWKN